MEKDYYGDDGRGGEVRPCVITLECLLTSHQLLLWRCILNTFPYILIFDFINIPGDFFQWASLQIEKINLD